MGLIELLPTVKLGHKEIVSFYDDIAWRYDISEPIRHLARKKAFSLLRGIYENSPANFAIDIGTGTGESAKYLSKISNNLVLVDPSKNMLRVSSNKYLGEYNFSQMLVENLAFPQKTFDLALISFVIHHLPLELARHSIREAIRITKKHLLIVEPISLGRKVPIPGIQKLEAAVLDKSAYFQEFIEYGIDNLLGDMGIIIKAKIELAFGGALACLIEV